MLWLSTLRRGFGTVKRPAVLTHLHARDSVPKSQEKVLSHVRALRRHLLLLSARPGEVSLLLRERTRWQCTVRRLSDEQISTC